MLVSTNTKIIENIPIVKTCCNNRNIIYEPEPNEYLCINCGTVLGYSIDLYPDAESMGKDAGINVFNIKTIINSSRPNLDWSTNGINSSIINPKNRDYTGKTIDKYMAKKLRDLDRMCTSKSNKNRYAHIKEAKQTIVNLAGKLGLPDHVTDRAGGIYNKAYEKQTVKGRSISLMAAVCVYIACREEDPPIIRELSDIAYIFESKTIRKKKNRITGLYEVQDADQPPEIRYKKVRSAKKIEPQLFEFFQILVDELDIKLVNLELKHYINHVGQDVGVSESTIRKAIELSNILKDLQESIFFGKSPRVISTCLLFIASRYVGETIKQMHIVEKTGLSTVTMRTRCLEYVDILNKNGYEIPEKLRNSFLVTKT